MKEPKRAGAWLGAVASAALLASCGGTGSSGNQTTIDLTSVEAGIQEMAALIPVCNPAGAPGPAPATDLVRKTPWLSRFVDLAREASFRAKFDWQRLSPTQPDDVFGDCGGRITFPNYSHSNGTTTGTLQFDNFCSVDSETGGHSIANGTISFVDHGTPGQSGPISTSFEADSPGGVTFNTQTSGGTQLTSQKVVFSDYLFEPGVPGGTPTASNPDQTSLGDGRLSDLMTGKTYRQTDYTATSFTTGSGGQSATISGRSYRSNGDYFDVNTSTPLTLDAAGNFTGGEVSFTGAGGSTAVFTVVPGATLQGRMTVNGTPVTNVPACQ